MGTAGLVLRWGGDERWERMSVPTAAHLHAVAFCSPHVLLAAGALRSTLLRSVDAGRSWQVRAARCPGVCVCASARRPKMTTKETLRDEERERERVLLGLCCVLCAVWCEQIDG